MFIIPSIVWKPIEWLWNLFLTLIRQRTKGYREAKSKIDYELKKHITNMGGKITILPGFPKPSFCISPELSRNPFVVKVLQDYAKKNYLEFDPSTMTGSRQFITFLHPYKEKEIISEIKMIR